MGGHAQLRNPQHCQSKISLVLPKNLEHGEHGELRQLIEEAPSHLLDQLALLYDTNISISALPDNLRNIALTCKVMQRVAAECDDAHQAEWIWSGY